MLRNIAFWGSKSFIGGAVMVTFSIPIKEAESKTKSSNKQKEAQFFSFSVPQMSVLFAGSRYKKVSQSVCNSLVQALAKQGFSFLIGCAEGVDRSFRLAISKSQYHDRCFVACAFRQRLKEHYTCGLFASVVVPKNIPPKAALHRRTVWMVKRCSMVVLFPDNPKDGSWGKGSRLVFKAALYNLKPMFIVSSTPPPRSIHYRVLKSSLFGIVEGYWVVPHPIKEGGTCDDE